MKYIIQLQGIVSSVNQENQLVYFQSDNVSDT